MTIEIKIKGKEEDSKVFEIHVERVIKGITKFSVLSFIGKEINRVRPPRRNIGSIINWMGAFAVTDAVMNLAFPKKTEDKEPENDVQCEPYSEVIERSNEDER